MGVGGVVGGCAPRLSFEAVRATLNEVFAATPIGWHCVGSEVVYIEKGRIYEAVFDRNSRVIGTQRQRAALRPKSRWPGDFTRNISDAGFHGEQHSRDDPDHQYADTGHGKH